MHTNRIHQRATAFLATTAIAVALLGVTSAGAASSGAPQGRVVFHCTGSARFGPPGPLHGKCTVTGAIADRGFFADDALQGYNPHIRTLNARKGTIRISVYRKRGNWMIVEGTKAYAGLRGRGWESNSGRCRGSCYITIKMVGTVSR